MGVMPAVEAAERASSVTDREARERIDAIRRAASTSEIENLKEPE
jgi:hypothetical protein